MMPPRQDPRPDPGRGAGVVPLEEAFGWDPTGEVAVRIGRVVSDRLDGLPERAAWTVDQLAVVAGDYRLVAEYLRAAHAGQTAVVNLLEQIAVEPDQTQRGRLRYELGRVLFADPDSSEPVTQGGLAEIVGATDANLCVDDDRVRPVLTRLLSELGPGLRAFVENQHEVPGPNARVRQGVVKSWHLPDGTRVASKRGNPLKPERFLREQHCWAEVAQRLGTDAGETTPMGNGDRRREVAVVPRLGLIRDRVSSEVYAVSRWIDGVSVETLLHGLPPGPSRTAVLSGYRALIDFLLDRGVLWGDMSPRNVLLDSDAERDVFWLVDFEKTTIVDAPVPPRARVEFCRGQVGVEELGVLCPRSELEDVLAGYFAPSEWDVTSSAPLSFPARPEVAGALRIREIDDPTQGEYDTVDLEILGVRTPDTDPETGRRRLPGLVGFRIEHYLTCASVRAADEYETRTTEILIAARRAGCFNSVWQALADAADRVEREFVVNEFTGVLERTGSESTIRVPASAVRELTSLIDRLYASRDMPTALRYLSLPRRREVVP